MHDQVHMPPSSCYTRGMSPQDTWLSRRQTFLYLLVIVGLGGLSAQLEVENYALKQEYEPTVAEFQTTSQAYQQLTANLRDKFFVVTQRNDSLATTLGQEQQ